MVSDSGSLCWGNEFNGMVIIVLSPIHAIVFLKLEQSLELMKKMKFTNLKSNILYEDISEDIVDIINNRVVESSFEYYINPN